MLDVAGHLSSFGWKGHGTALREGAITRPLLVSQKKSLSGLGKDRDEAYPFWDHVFAAAAKTITIKIAGSDDEQSLDEEASTSKRVGAETITRTKTGIISNRRPTSTCTTPGDATPDLVSDATTSSSSSQLSIMSQAKREAAKRALYARFYRGPVIKSEVDAELDEPAKKKRKRAGDDDSDSSDDGNVGTHWRTLAAAVTAPAADDKAGRKAARAERKAARAERRALRAAKREAKRAKEERKERRHKADEVAPATTAPGEESKKEKKKRRDSSAADDAASEVEKPKKRKKRKADE